MRTSIPSLLRFLALHCAIGVTAGWTILAALICADIGGLRSLIVNSGAPAVPVAMLVVMFAITFGGAAMATAVLLLPKDDGEGRE